MNHLCFTRVFNFTINTCSLFVCFICLYNFLKSYVTASWWMWVCMRKEESSPLMTSTDVIRVQYMWHSQNVTMQLNSLLFYTRMYCVKVGCRKWRRSRSRYCWKQCFLEESLPGWYVEFYAVYTLLSLSLPLLIRSCFTASSFNPHPYIYIYEYELLNNTSIYCISWIWINRFYINSHFVA